MRQLGLDRVFFIQVCSAISACDKELALQALATSIAAHEYISLPQILADAGVTLTASGTIDFIGDGNRIHWAVVHDPVTGAYSFWVFPRSEEHALALPVGEVSRPSPTIEMASFSISDNGHRVAMVDRSIYFSLVQLPTTGEYAVVHHEAPSMIVSTPEVELYQDALDEAWILLAAGREPDRILDQLRQVVDSETLDCRYGPECPEALYLLALAHELGADLSTASAVYSHLWMAYPESLYAVAARVKLDPPTP